LKSRKKQGAKVKVLITGGSGFVGRNLTQRLVKEGHEITITSTGSEPVVPGVKKVLYMGLNGIDWTKVCNQDIVFHLMANNDTLCKDYEEMFRANVSGPVDLFNFALKHGCKKFVYASSTAVYGSEQAPYIEEKTPINPINIYGQSKAVFDEFAISFAKENDVNVIGLRYCNIYGPGEDQKGRRMSVIGQILRNMLANKRPVLFKNGEQKRDWIYVDDIVEANILSMQKNISGVFNIGSGESHSFNEIIEVINKLLKSNIQPEYIECPFLDNYQSYTECDITKAKRELGFDPKFSFLSGIETYYRNLTS
jgi:ADP-L-glycero-D-manno-heptose 6-epimerase